MCNTHYILFDNRTGIQFRSHIMTGCTDNLHTSLKCGMIRLCSHKCRKERVVDINNLIRINHLFGDHLHITCQYDKGNVMFGKQFHFFTFLFFFCLFGDRKQVERNTETFSHMLQIRMVTYNKRYFYIPFACRITSQHIKKTVGHFRDKYSHTRFHIREIKTEIHFILLPI